MYFTSALERFTRNRNLALKTLIASPVAQAALAEADANEAAGRAELVARLAAVPSKYDKCIKAALQDQARADAALKKAKDDLNTAMDAQRRAAIELCSASNGQQNEIGKLTHALESSADPRLATYVDFLGDIFEKIRHFTHLNEKTVERKSPNHSNPKYTIHVRPTVQAAVDGLVDARTKVTAMRQQADTRAAITDALRAVSAQLRPLLAPFNLSTPRVFSDHVLPPVGGMGDELTEDEAGALDLRH
jgi:hypothetical protein